MKEQTFPLHPAQRDVFVDQLINRDSPHYNIGGYIKFKGKIDKEKFLQVINSAPEVFDVFKMRFDLGNLNPIGYIDKTYHRLDTSELDLSENLNPTAYAEKWMQDRFNTPFNIQREELLFEHVLIKISRDEHWFFHRYHHLITDGYGFANWVNYIAEKYKSLISGEEFKFHPISYEEEAITASEYIGSEKYETDGNYWKRKITEKPVKLLYKNYINTGSEAKRSSNFVLNISRDQRKLIEQIQSATGATIQQLTIAAMAVYMGKTSDRDNFLFGIPVHKRSSRKARTMVGMFSGILPFSCDYREDFILTEFLRAISTAQKSDYRHQNYPIGDLSRYLKINPSEGYLTEISINMEILNFELDFGKDLQAFIMRMVSEREKNPIELCWRDYGGTQPLQLDIHYLNEYFSKEEVELLAKRLLHILEQFPSFLDQTLEGIEILTKEDKKLLNRFNDTSIKYHSSKLVLEMFEEQVLKKPDQIALEMDSNKWTYEQLNSRANQLARFLIKKGADKEVLIPICIERGLDMVLGILGILKSGAAYVPIDPEYPEERIGYMLSDTNAKLVISSKKSRTKFNEQGLDIIEMDGDWEEISIESTENPLINIKSENLAFVIYTSGSTGQPKGVMVEHGNIYSFISWCHEEFSAEKFDVSYAVTSICFDLSVFELFYPLTVGKRIRILESGLYIGKYLHKDKKVMLNSVPSVVENLLREGTDLTSVKVMNMAGEPISTYVQQKIDTQRTEIRNLYGPTEDTTYSTVFRIESGKPVYIGKPISNTQVWISNPAGKLVPAGVAGEICLGGSGIARGYLNLPELTNERFIEDPFSKDKGARLYKTGDLGRWLPDGNIEYLGRIDDQVKIRGFRIELGEIDATIQKSEQVKKSIVVAKKDENGVKRLIAYVVPNDNYSKEKIQVYLKTKLPDFMIPRGWVELEELPLTPNGKIDKRALPDPDISQQLKHQYVAPRNQSEQILAEIWKELLDLQHIGIHDNFFEFGGHSLLAMRVISAIRKQMDQELAVSELFTHPTIAELSDYLSSKEQTALLPQIQVKQRPDQIPLSFSQERLWFIDRLEGSIQYHIPAVLRLRGVLNRGALQFAIKKIIARHEILRTVILEHDGVPYQYIMPSGSWHLNILENKTFIQSETKLHAHIQELINKPFDLSQDYMIRGHLISLGEEEHLLVVILHHIAADGWSASVIVRELAALYNSQQEGYEIKLNELAVQYADYAIWQRNYLQGDFFEDKIQYWVNKLQGVQPLQIPIDYIRPAQQSNKGGLLGYVLEKELTEQLQGLSQQQNATMFMTLLAAFKTLLFKYSDQTDICIGTPIAGRQQEEVESLVGFFVNTLALRTDLSGNPTFITLLEKVKQTTLDAYENQEVPFEKVVESVVKDRDLRLSPLFQILFVWQNNRELQKMQLGDLSLTQELFSNNTAIYDITFSIRETIEGLQVNVEYCSDLFKAETIQIFVNHYKELLISIVTKPHIGIEELSILSAYEEELIIKEFNNTRTKDTEDWSIISIFEKQVEITPDAIAVVMGKDKLTYSELNSASNRLAKFLRNRGFGFNSLIPICIERSLDMIVGVLGILKAGAAYVPIDPEYPQQRIEQMLEDMEASLILCSSRGTSKLFQNGYEVIEIDRLGLEKRNDWEKNPGFDYKSNHLAYLLYTSGSTGKPKGVKMNTGSLVNLLEWQKKQFTNKNRKVLQFASLNFDVSFQEIFSTLCYGSTLYLISSERRTDLREIFKDITDYGLTHLFVPYALLKNLAEYILPRWSAKLALEEIIVAGEQLKLTTEIDGLISNCNIKLINHYGPTESHVVTSYIVDSKEDINRLPPIGKPVDNTSIFILKSDNQLSPIGIPGEIYIGGVQVSQGYLNNPKLTIEKFLTDPFSKQKGARIYKTGDIGRWLPDGNIEYLGRRDDQVKIRGYRIELGEIETTILQSDHVNDCTIVSKTDKQGIAFLVCYVVPRIIYDRERLVKFLKTRLTEYMIPRVWVEMESIPLNANGKVNKKKLPEPELDDNLKTLYVAPKNETEQLLAEIWQELLGIEYVGSYSNFFELGGHSLLAMRVISGIRKQFDIEISVKDLFTYSTVSELATFIGLREKGLILPPVSKMQLIHGSLPLSFSQERLWFIDKLEGSLEYHLPAILKITGKLNISALEKTFKAIIQRHESLRTVILDDQGKAFQQINDTQAWQLNSIEIKDHLQGTHESDQLISNLVNKPFDLSKDYMLRADLLKYDVEQFILVITLHHISSDGWSISILVREIIELYDAFDNEISLNLKPLEIQYADYALWQRNYLQGEILDRKLEYWERKLTGINPLQLPTDRVRPAIQAVKGAVITCQLEGELTERLNQLNKSQSTTMFMTMLAAYNILLYRYSNQDDICVGAPVAGRQQHETEGLIGYFVNTISLRNKIDDSNSFVDFLQEVKTNTIEAFDHQEVPFEKVVDRVANERDLTRSPIYQVLFVFQNTPPVPEMKLGKLRVILEKVEQTTTRFELSLYVNETKSGLELQLEYSTDLFNESTIKRFLDHYLVLLDSMCRNPEAKIVDLKILDEKEESLLLNEFNNTQVQFPKESNVIIDFEKQVEKSPDAIALMFEDKNLTYFELNQKANQLSFYLNQQGVGNESVVAICMERGLDMIVAMLGILKSGGAYVPIDPEYPADRINFMLKDSGSIVVLGSSNTAYQLKNSNLPVFEIDTRRDELEKYSLNNPEFYITPQSLAYIIYTSGSTGQPKGVMIEHASFFNYVFQFKNYFSFSPQDTILQQFSISFDTSIEEIFPALMAGSKIRILKNGAQDTELIKNFIENGSVTLISSSPLIINFLNAELKSLGNLRYVISGGDVLKPSHIDNLFGKVDILNGYGPTEATIAASFNKVSSMEQTSIIGKPTDNVKIHILDGKRNLSPIGVPGEICIAGIQVSRGYLNQPLLTQEKFIMDPFSTEPGARIYRTGDLGRWLEDGNIEYLGRIDDQVKIRGYRIELGEIESFIQQSGLTSQSVVIAHQDKEGVKRLIGYVVASKHYSKQELQTFLQSKLPEYMVPRIWIELESIPLTANGKIDKRALPQPDMGSQLTREYVAPRNITQQTLAEIWQELLGVKQVGVEDNFFELGGDSILTIQVVSRARRAGLEMEPRDLFTHQTIQQLSTAIGGRISAQTNSEQGTLEGYSGMLPIQQWYFSKTTEELSHFNQSVLLKVDKGISQSQLEAVVKHLVHYHDALRFKYQMGETGWTQQYGLNPGELDSSDLSQSSEKEFGERLTQLCQTTQQSLDITKGDIVRCVWIQTPSSHSHNRFLMVIHHLAVDGVSWRILLEDMEVMLQGITQGQSVQLGAKSSSYRQWYEALDRYSQTKAQKQISYWQKIQESYTPLTTDTRYTGAVLGSQLKTYSSGLSKTLTTQLLQEISGVYRTDINDILLSALASAVSQWQNTHTLSIGLEGHGREHIEENIDLNRTVGWFTSLYPVHLDIADIADKSELIKTVKEQLRQVPDKGLGYGVLKYISQHPTLQGEDPWDIVFNYLGQLDTAVSSSQWFSAATEAQGSMTSALHQATEKLSINSYVESGELKLNWSYSELHYHPGSIEALTELYIQELQHIIEHCKTNQDKTYHTPSDYGLAKEISYKELDAFLDGPQQLRDRIEGLYRLSGLQQGMLFHSLYSEQSGAYVEQLHGDIVDLDEQSFIQSWNELLSNHTVLRSGFYYDSLPVAVQCVFKHSEIPVIRLDYREYNENRQKTELEQYLEQDRLEGFDFTQSPLMRLTLIQLSESKTKMIWTSHHILFDGWSLPIVMEELLENYQKISQGQQVSKKQQDKFEDYIRYLEKDETSRSEDYWKSYLSPLEEPTFLPFISKSGNRNSGIGNYSVTKAQISGTKSSEIQNYCRQKHITVNTLMQGVWSYLLQLYTGNNTISYGITVSGRPENLQGVEQRVGMYINTIPLVTEFEPDKQIIQWLSEIQDQQISSREYQYTPLPEIQTWSPIKGDLFDSILVFENYPVSKVIGRKDWKLKVENITVTEQTNYPLTIAIHNSEEIDISLSYNSDILFSNNANLIKDQFLWIIDEIVRNPNGKCSEINPLRLVDEEHVKTFNQTETEYSDEKTVVQKFEEQVERNPDAIALIYNNETYTYKQLNERSNQLAHYLQSKGIGAESMVPVCLHRSSEMVVAMLGIMKSGAAYVPIDPEYPQDRIDYILEDIEANVIVTNGLSEMSWSRTNLKVIDLTLDEKVIGTFSNQNPNNTIKFAQLAYIIYTSGSTGKPKGVMVEHISLENYLTCKRIGPISDNIEYSGSYVHFSYTFDASVSAIFMPLVYGKNMVISGSQYLNVFDDPNFVNYAPYDFIKITPSHLPLLEPYFLEYGNLGLTQKLIIGGEALIPAHFNFFVKNNIDVEVTNEYGPTEATVGCIIYSFRSNEVPNLKSGILIGKPISNSKVYIVNNNKQVPIGIVGEIYLGGVGVARGYLNLPELTREKFIKNDFSPGIKERLYKSGDLGIWLPDGNIEYVGRRDDQVKIRGYRIELGEIEAVATLFYGISQCVVLAKNDTTGGKRLIGYIIPNKEYDQEKFKSFLSKKLPSYMIPQLWVELPVFPLNSHGKIDRNQLTEPDIEGLANQDYVAPRNKIEQTLHDIWCDILQVGKISILSNFFELGGHSLLAMRVKTVIKKKLNLEPSIKDLFEFSTIESLADYLNTKQVSDWIPKLEILPRPKNIPLSFSQERLWFIDKLEGSINYHLPIVLDLSGDLNIEALENSIKMLMHRHEILRTVIYDEDGEGFQYIRDESDWKIKFTDYSEYKDAGLSLENYIQQQIELPFNLAEDFMLRAELVKLHPLQFKLVIVIHHIVSDGWSNSIIVKELVQFYNSLDKGIEVTQTPLHFQYADYAIWQRHYLKGNILDVKLNYWKAKLEGVASLELPTDKVRPALQSSQGSVVNFNVNKKITDKLARLSKIHNATMFMTLLSAFKVLLHRYSGQDDICVGSPIAGRGLVETEELIGYFINTLALRTELQGDKSFESLLNSVKQTTIEAYEHQDVPFEKIIEATVHHRDLSRSPLFQVMFVYQNTPVVPELILGDIEIKISEQVQTSVKFEITLDLTETLDGLKGSFQFNTDIYNRSSIERLSEHFGILLTSISEDPKQAIDKLKLIGESEKNLLTNKFNVSKISYPEGLNFVGLFETMAERTPDAIAIVFEGSTVNYKNLNEKANQIAHALISKGVGRDSLVPLFMNRGWEMMAGMLGILKSGGAYVPIDTELPSQRINYILEDTGAKFLVAEDKFSDIKSIDKITFENTSHLSTSNPDIKITNSQLVYVIYTSGSTGVPKGVMVEHGQLIDYIYGLDNQININNQKSFALVSSFSTDLGNTVIFTALAFGGALHVFSKQSVTDPQYLNNYFEENEIECLKIVPSHWKALSVDKLLLPKSLLIFGGEALQSEILKKIDQSGANCRVINHYGPTETTIGKLLHSTLKSDKYPRSIPIGKPFGNTRLFVLSKSGEISPIGVPGELYIGGDGVARGYLNNTDLTERKFVDLTWSHKVARYYATGDLVKYHEDGNLEFLGRTDTQVKIRGYRVEPTEIERVIEQNEMILQSAIVTIFDEVKGDRLVAYLVTNELYEREKLLYELKNKLPDYMIPSTLVEIDHIPLTPNGKIDRKALPDPNDLDFESGNYVAPVTETEIALVQIWETLLGYNKISVNDNFFEIGGHSLLAMRVISAIRKGLGKELAVKDIFNNPTILELSKYLIFTSSHSILPPIQVEERPLFIPLSYSQERLWFLDRLEGSTQYHIPMVMKLKGNLNVEYLKDTLIQIIQRHEILRTVIKEVNGIGYQFVKDTADWKLQILNLSGKDLTSANTLIHQLISKPFDLSSDYMLRANLIQTDIKEYILVLVLHHVASDGWSTSVLVKEVEELYMAYSTNRMPDLPALLVQYADYSIWQRNHIKGDLLNLKLEYWKNKLENVIPLELPTDYARPIVQSNNGATFHFKLDKKITDKLEKLSQKTGATMFMTALSAFNVLLQKYSNQEDICIGTPIAGRQHHEIENVIGYFVNTLALRTNVNNDLSFTQLLLSVKETTLEAYENQEIPFEKVVDATVYKRDMSRSPLFQVMFLYQNTPPLLQVHLPEIELKIENVETGTSKFDLLLGVVESNKGLEMSFEYCTDLFKESTIQRLKDHLLEILASIADNPENKIHEIRLIGKQDEVKILNSFNNRNVEFPQDKTITEIFEQQADLFPDKEALVFEDSSLTYKELNEKANRLAHYLVQKGIRHQAMVPVCLERSAEMIIAILAILKSGGAYVPIDPEYPQHRIDYMLDDTTSKIVLGSKSTKQKLKGESREFIDVSAKLPADLSTKNLGNQDVGAGSLAYIIYTSGSTGTPKGVMVEHKNVVSLAKGGDFVNITKEDILLSTGSISFDATTIEYWGMLLNGGKLVICSEECLMDIDRLKNEINSQKVTLMWFTSGWFNRLVETDIRVFEPLQTIMVGGEKLSEWHINTVIAKYPNKKIINGYGPTENTTFSLTYPITKKEGRIIPIGKPLANRSAYILDNEHKLLPIGIPGEIYVGGAGVSRGYLNQPLLTQEKFILDPFSTEPGARMYRTGDLGRWLEDGNIEYLGRIDDQVKIRGYRIELGEIESFIQQSGLTSQSVVIAHQDKEGIKRLIGYVVASGHYSKQELQTYLQSKLPEYMVPRIWIELESIPLTANGKIDKRALPQPDMGSQLTREYVAPRNITQQTLAEIWQELLGVKQVGVEDNFFELGGDSILTIQVVSRARRAGLEMEPRDLFTHQTIQQLSTAIGGRISAQTNSEQGTLEGYSGMLPIQQWYFSKTTEELSHFNQSVLLKVDKGISQSQLEAVVKHLVHYHDALRFKYQLSETGWTQQYGLNPGELGQQRLKPKLRKGVE
jgi:amino acid adenylation domain-containing protein/non-ribosomal peptide synthase protein (TIGR01720 family)